MAAVLACVAVPAPGAPAEPDAKPGEAKTDPAAKLFDLLDLKDSRLVRVRLRVARKDYTAALRALGDHFLTRQVRTNFWPRDGRSANTADDIVRHVFSFYGSKKFDAGNPIQWDRVFLDDREITYALNRHQHLAVLAFAYRQTRDPKYVGAFVEQVRDWIERNPLGATRNWAAWRDLETAVRIGVWSDVFFQFLHAPEFTPADQARMLLSLHEQATWLAPQVRAGRSDWSISVATGLAAVGVLFPEFNEAGQWRKRAYGELIRDMEMQVYPDGSHKALSLYRHNACVSAFWLPMKIAVENRIAIPGVYRETLERMCAFLAYVRRPDGKYPAFNASEPQDAAMIVLAAGRFFGRGDLAYIVSRGKSGTAPSSTSLLLPQSGIAVMRDGWGADANYMAIDAGPYGTDYQHEDKLGFDLAAFGRTVLVDPGRYSLDDTDPMTRHLRQTAAHNTVTVGGSGQTRSRFRESWVAGGNDPVVWVSRPEFDYFAGRYTEGYETAANVSHHRRVLFVKDKRQPYWVVSDRLEGSGDHLLEVRFQFVPGQLRKLGDLAFGTTADAGNLAIVHVPADLSTATARILTGSRQPLGGWVSSAYRKIEPAPQLVYSRRASLPATMDFVLAPHRGAAVPPAVRAEDAVVHGGTGVTALTLDFGEFTDTVVVDHALGEIERTVAGFKTKGCFVVARQGRDGSPKIIFDADARSVRTEAAGGGK